MPSDLLDLAPKTLHQGKAECGCEFSLVLRQCFDPRRGWGESCYLIGAPCSDAHRPIAEAVAESHRREPAAGSLIAVLVAELAAAVKKAA